MKYLIALFVLFLFSCNMSVYESGWGVGTIDMPDSTFYITKHYSNGIDEYWVYKYSGEFDILKDYKMIKDLMHTKTWHHRSMKGAEFQLIQHYFAE